MLVYKIRGPDFDLQRGEEHHIIEQKKDGFSLQHTSGTQLSSKQEEATAGTRVPNRLHIGKNSVMNNNQITKGKTK